MRRFRFEWRISMATAIFLPLMLLLGFWQLHRADENRALLLEAEHRHRQSPKDVDTLPYDRISADLQTDMHVHWKYLPVKVTGSWQNKYFLLENQTNQGRNGYHVLGVIRTGSGRLLLVNRGWVPAPLSRTELPKVPDPAIGKIELAEVYFSPELNMDQDIYAESGWPKRIGIAHLPVLSREFGEVLEPFVLRLQKGSPSALVVDWLVVNIAPEKNIAYAIQWFAMSLALAILYVVFSFRIAPENAEEV